MQVIRVITTASNATAQFNLLCLNVISDVCNRHSKSISEKLSSQFSQIFTDLVSEITIDISKASSTSISMLNTSYIHWVNPFQQSVLKITVNKFDSRSNLLQQTFNVYSYAPKYDLDNLTLNQVTL
jgi:hypothetical protein